MEPLSFGSLQHTWQIIYILNVSDFLIYIIRGLTKVNSSIPLSYHELDDLTTSYNTIFNFM